MQVKNNLYNIVFILIIAIFFSSILAVTSYTLKDKQRLAEEEDIKKNILKVAGILDYDGKIIKGAVSGNAECSDINCLYKNNIKTIIFDSKGKKVEDKNINPLTFDIAKQLKVEPGKRIYPVFIRKSDNKISSYCIPIYGKGLWSSIYGFVSLGNDLNTVKGLTFYKQGETPGLGAEIQSKSFQNSFKNKKIYDEKGKLVSIELVKASMKDENKVYHQVDSISGASITSKGVSALLKECLIMYEPFIMILKKGKGVYGIN